MNYKRCSESSKFGTATAQAKEAGSDGERPLGGWATRGLRVKRKSAPSSTTIQKRERSNAGDTRSPALGGRKEGREEREARGVNKMEGRTAPSC